MEVLIKAMFLEGKTGQKENGDYYYQGKFLEVESNHIFNLYFTNSSELNSFEARKEYELPCKLYLGGNSKWYISLL